MQRPSSISLAALILTGLCVSKAFSAEAPVRKPAELTKENVEFFETNIRPVLAERCFDCHSAQAKKVKGGLLLDSPKGVTAGGDSGPVIVPGDVENSPLIQAIRWTDSDLAMPPKAKLTPQQVQKFEQWVQMGAPDPRTEASATVPAKAKTRDLEADRKWWAFLPVAELPTPTVNQPDWPRERIDLFVLKEIEARQLRACYAL